MALVLLIVPSHPLNIYVDPNEAVEDLVKQRTIVDGFDGDQGEVSQLMGQIGWSTYTMVEIPV